MRRTTVILLAMIILSSCALKERPDARSQSPQATEVMFVTPALPLADYPPAGTPYYVEGSDFWLVHTPEGRLLVFAPVSPEYAEQISVDECRFAWIESVQRFTDPCSGDEWELDGRLNITHSTELWSNRDLDQYSLAVEDGMIYVHLSQKKPGTLRVGSQAPQVSAFEPAHRRWCTKRGCIMAPANPTHRRRLHGSNLMALAV